MKSNFTANYKRLQQEQQNPLKVFVKLGSVHTARGTSFNGFQDVGNTVYELARFNGTKSYSIISFPRYISNEMDGTIEDEVEESGKELLEFTSSKQWSLIDLRKLEMLRIEHKIRLSEHIKSYIQKYDALLIPPATTYSTKN